MEPSRVFIREGTATIVTPSQKRFNGTVFLFNDVVVLAKKGFIGIGDKYSIEERIPLLNSNLVFGTGHGYVIICQRFQSLPLW